MVGCGDLCGVGCWDCVGSFDDVVDPYEFVVVHVAFLWTWCLFVRVSSNVYACGEQGSSRESKEGKAFFDGASEKTDVEEA